MNTRLDTRLAALFRQIEYERSRSVVIWEWFYQDTHDLSGFLADQNLCFDLHQAYYRTDRYILRYQEGINLKK